MQGNGRMAYMGSGPLAQVSLEAIVEEKERGESKGEENKDRPAPHLEARKLM